MSAHRTLNDLFRAFDAVGPGQLEDPGDAGTITVKQWGQICSVVTTASQARTLAQPTKAGVLAAVVLDTDGGDLTLTVTGGYNQAGSTTIVFGDAGDFAVFYSVKVGTTYRWQLFASEGVDVTSAGGVANTRDMTLYGAITDAYVQFLAASNQLGLFGPMRPRGFNAQSPRFELKWVAGARGKPGINADIQDATEAVRMIADPDFEVLGESADTSTVTYYVEGGLTLTTKTTSADQVIIAPHLDANQTGWTQVTWGSDQETEWECHIRAGAAITTSTIWAGLKLTDTSVTATDDDQAFFRYQNGVNDGKFQAVSSRGGTDTATDTGITVAINTEYHLKITIDAARVPRFYINGALVVTGAALVTEKDFKPYIGVQTGTTAARVIVVRGQSISRKMA